MSPSIYIFAQLRTTVAILTASGVTSVYEFPRPDMRSVLLSLLRASVFWRGEARHLGPEI